MLKNRKKLMRVFSRCQADARHFPWRLAAGFLLLALVFTYVGTTNSVATQGYQLNDLQSELVSLQKKNTAIEFNISAVGSLERIEAGSDNLARLPLENIEYLTATTAVAVR